MATKRTHTLTPAEILARALEIVDAEGLEKLTMRRLARELGVEAMTLYHHFPNKEAILDGVAEAILNEMTLPEPIPEDWMDLLVSMCLAFRRTLARHPNALPVLMARPLNPPEGATVTPVGVLQDQGFDPVDMIEMYQALMALTFGHAVVSAVSPSPSRAFSLASGDEGFARAIRILIEGYASQTPPRDDGVG